MSKTAQQTEIFGVKIRVNQTNPGEDKWLWILLSLVSLTHRKEVPLTIEQLNAMSVIGFFAQLGHIQRRDKVLEHW